ncbi:MAG: hypothetical protein D3910_14530 [Candidatus Electrothrix sp. ATG2]|nr:hypothetical protein [Candidatus Electrothrix sp. ATG2]
MSTTKVLLAGVITLAMTAPCFHIASAEALNANTNKSERTYRKKKSGEGALTQNMLEACIELKAEIDEEFKKISGSKEKFDTLNKEVSELAAYLKGNKEKVAGKNLIEHNKQVEGYNQKVKELENMQGAYNEKSATYREKTEQLAKECTGQPYYEDDYAAVVKKTGKEL